MSRILMVEDDPVAASIYERQLTKEGFKVDIVNDGETAIDLLPIKKPDLVLLDLMLPKMSGVDVLRKIRSQPAFQELPVIVLSVGYLGGMLQEAGQAGATRIITKGNHTPKQVAQEVRIVLSQFHKKTKDRVLVVEDDDLTARIYWQALVQEGYTVDVAADGEIALEMIHSRKPDLILLDLMLPKINGVGVLKRIRPIPSLRDLPVIVFTQVYSLSDILREAREAGATQIVTKGNHTPAQIVQEVRNMLNQTKASDKKRVLMVEDDALIARIYCQKLMKEGFIVDIASDGETALEMIQGKHPDVLLLDLMLPNISGLEVLKRIRSQPALRDLPVVVFTQLYFSDLLREAKEIGATKVVTKTDHTPQEVVNEVLKALASSAGNLPAVSTPERN